MKRTIIVLLMLLALTALLGACGSQRDDLPGPDTLVIGVGRDFYNGPDAPLMLHGSSGVVEFLVYLDDNMEPVGELAESWTRSEDGLTWTFKLKQGVFFHDGSELTAEVAVFNLERLYNHPKTANPEQVYGKIVAMKELDKYTFSITHAEPVGNYASQLAYMNSPILAKASFDKKGNTVKPIGSGPYIFDRYVKDSALYLVKNPAYRLGEPNLARVIFKVIPDPATRVNALLAGEVDALADVGAILPEQVPTLQASANIVLKEQKMATTHYLLASGKKLADNAGLLFFVGLVIDRQTIVDELLYGCGVPASEFVNRLLKDWYWNESFLYDPVTAALDIQYSFAPSGVPLTILLNQSFNARWPYQAVAEVLQAELVKLGFPVTIETVDHARWLQRTKAGDYGLTFSPYTFTTGDPAAFFCDFLMSGGSLNVARGLKPGNVSLDELILEACATDDPFYRRGMFYELQMKLFWDAPLLPLWHEWAIYAHSKELQGFKLDWAFRPSLFTSSK